MPDDNSRLRELEELVRVLAAGLGLDPSYRVPADVYRHLQAGEQVKAIRELRRQSPGKLSLISAKRMVDALSEGSL